MRAGWDGEKDERDDRKPGVRYDEILYWNNRRVVMNVFGCDSVLSECGI